MLNIIVALFTSVLAVAVLLIILASFGLYIQANYKYDQRMSLVDSFKFVKDAMLISPFQKKLLFLYGCINGGCYITIVDDNEPTPDYSNDPDRVCVRRRIEDK